MTPLSIVFRVDATDDEDARRQLADVIGTANTILSALGVRATLHPQPARVEQRSPITGRMVDVNRDGTNTSQTDQTRRAPRPWDDDPRGMGA